MSSRNHKRIPEKGRKARRYGLGKGCLGLLLLIAGIGMSLDTARLEEVPLWVTAGPDINVYQEGLSAADINVECLLQDGQIELKLFPGEQMEEEVNVWLSVTDLFFPYQWKIRRGTGFAMELQRDGRSVFKAGYETVGS